MAVTRTRTELIQEVAKVLGALASGQVLPAEDEQDIDDLIDPAIDELAQRDVIYIDDNQTFDSTLFLALVDAIAAFGASKYMVAQIRGQDIETFRELAERRLRRMKTTGPQYTVMKAEYS